MPVYVERTIFELPRIYINGGHRGFLVEMDPKDMARVVEVTPVDAAQAPG
jgi:prolyl-tRNA editing enzyme YbaK/EbsC (Cys-tRNA(Pro) deacylase)